MRDWLTREVRGAPFWLLAVALVVILAGTAVIVPSLVRSAPAPAAPAPAYTPQPATTRAAPFTVPADPRLLILGDSYTEGFAATPLTQGYAYLVGKSLGWRTDIDAAGGTGFTFGGTSDYGSRIRAYIRTSSFKPNVIVLEGSQNDYRSIATITATVVADVRALKAAYPDARIVLFGPAAPQPLQSQLGPIDAADQAAADELGIPYISPYQLGWLTTANTLQYGYSDGAHLNTEGHAYLARQFLAEFKPLFR